MGLREWSFGGILLSPFLIYALLALLITGVLRWVLHRTGMNHWIWHEAFFDCALYVCVLSLITQLLGPI